MGFKGIWSKFYRTLASVQTGIILLILVVLLSALGTLILQRPTTEPDVLQRAYSPTTLVLLDRLGMLDIYHSWYFLALLGLVSLSIMFVSLDRWPNAWRFYARPYRRTEPHFRASLPVKAQIPVLDSETSLQAAERGFAKMGLPVERIEDNGEVSLYSEKHRFAVLAVYIVHASLLLIFLGGIVDGLFGYRGFMRLLNGQTSNSIELRAGSGSTGLQKIPFEIRCDNVGQEAYSDGSPKKYWSDLAIIENGREIRKKTIVVNDPFVYRGVRIFQASLGQSGKLSKAILVARSSGSVPSRKIEIGLNETVPLDEKYSVRLVRFVPDYFVQDNEVFTKSEWPDNPAFQLAVIDKAGQQKNMWLIPGKANTTFEDTAYKFSLADLKMVNFTGLEVAFQPGQWFVWAGVVLMALGLGVVFYMMHQRFWAVVVRDPSKGLMLWLGGASNRNRDRFEAKFAELVKAVRAELPGAPSQDADGPSETNSQKIASVGR